MYIIDIDIGKNHHEASIIDSSGMLIGKSCRFSNTHKEADTFGIKIAQSSFSFQLNQLFERLNILNEQLASLEEEITIYYKKYDCQLHTLPGVGSIAAATTCVFHDSPLNA